MPPFGSLKQLQGGSLVIQAYTYDPVGNLASLVDSVAGETLTYGYDELDRLLSVASGSAYSEAFTYDPLGSILSKQRDGGALQLFIWGKGGLSPITAAAEGWLNAEFGTGSNPFQSPRDWEAARWRSHPVERNANLLVGPCASYMPPGPGVTPGC